MRNFPNSEENVLKLILLRLCVLHIPSNPTNDPYETDTDFQVGSTRYLL